MLGYSLGGIVAQQLAHEQPDRIRRLGLVATACGWGSVPGAFDALALVSMPWRYHSRTLYEQTARLLGPADRELLRRLPALSEARLENPPPLLGYAYQLTAGAFWSSLPWLASVSVPTLVLNGEADKLVPSANGLQLARQLPESRVHIIAGEGHLFVCDPREQGTAAARGLLHCPDARALVGLDIGDGRHRRRDGRDGLRGGGRRPAAAGLERRLPPVRRHRGLTRAC